MIIYIIIYINIYIETLTLLPFPSPRMILNRSITVQHGDLQQLWKWTPRNARWLALVRRDQYVQVKIQAFCVREIGAREAREK